MARLNGFHSESAIEIGDGSFGCGKGIAILVFLSFFRSSHKVYRGKASRFACICTEHYAGDHALGRIRFLVLILVAPG
jgi:hypothetical protein